MSHPDSKRAGLAGAIRQSVGVAGGLAILLATPASRAQEPSARSAQRLQNQATLRQLVEQQIAAETERREAGRRQATARQAFQQDYLRWWAGLPPRQAMIPPRSGGDTASGAAAPASAEDWLARSRRFPAWDAGPGSGLSPVDPWAWTWSVGPGGFWPLPPWQVSRLLRDHPAPQPIGRKTILLPGGDSASIPVYADDAGAADDAAPGGRLTSAIGADTAAGGTVASDAANDSPSSEAADEAIDFLGVPADSDQAPALSRLFELAAAALEKGDYDRALARLEALPVEMGRVQLYRSLVETAIGDDVRAAEALELGLSQLPPRDWGWIVAWLPRLCPDRDRYLEGISHLEARLARHPDRATAAVVLGYHYGFHGFADRAAEVLARATSDPQFGGTALLLTERFGRPDGPVTPSDPGLAPQGRRAF